MLKETLQQLDEIPYLNSGGCAISALAIYRLLRRTYPKANGIELVNLFEAEWCDWCEAPICTCGEERICYQHTAVRYRDVIIDSAGILATIEDEISGPFCDGFLDLSDKETGYRLGETYSWDVSLAVPTNEDELLYELNHNSWNTCFNRKNVRKIERITNVKLTQVRRTHNGHGYWGYYRKED